jgi:2-polyprenyl-3-methyl-5-hydroxy-6-metoxy-1,4-benzoquinol methylase
MSARDEIEAGDRFAFGDNWARFLELVDEDRITSAEESLRTFLDVSDLKGKRFVDVGSGSGLFSLAAYRLGATVTSFDFDPQSVACTTELRRRYGDTERWTVEQGSALDADYLASLGTFDVVYSWGVLHHTGDMWTALDLVEKLIAPAGTLFLAIYNDQGRGSQMWRRVKKAYSGAGPTRQKAIVAATDAYFQTRALPGRTLNRLTRVKTPTTPARGMDRRRDLVDWVGGYPFEVAKPEQIFDFYRGRGYQLERMSTAGGGLACNQYVFTRD